MNVISLSISSTTSTDFAAGSETQVHPLSRDVASPPSPRTGPSGRRRAHVLSSMARNVAFSADLREKLRSLEAQQRPRLPTFDSEDGRTAWRDLRDWHFLIHPYLSRPLRRMVRPTHRR